MLDTERVEAIHKRLGPIKVIPVRPIMAQKPVPMELGSIIFTKLAADEREKCMK